MSFFNGMMNQPLLKLPYRGLLKCSQGNLSSNDRSHNKRYANTKYALDFTVNGYSQFNVRASADGIAKIWDCCKHKSGKCKCGLGFGNQIRIFHSGFFTFYSHLSKINVSNGQKIKQGDVIGVSGKTGLAGNVHLHWTLGRESKESISDQEDYVPFFSIKATNIEIIENNKRKIVSSEYFKENKKYALYKQKTR